MRGRRRSRRPKVLPATVSARRAPSRRSSRLSRSATGNSPRRSIRRSRIRSALARVFGEDLADERLRRYHEIEPLLQTGGARSYREVMTDAMRELGASEGQASGLAEALPSWEPFPEVPSALEDARGRGWK